MKTIELVFIPSPGVGHLFSTAEMAKLLIDRDERLSITVLTMTPPFDMGTNPPTNQPHDVAKTNNRICFLELKPDDDVSTLPSSLFDSISRHKTHVRKIVENILKSESTQLAGFVIDMFCSCMLDVANEFGLPTYVFFTSNAGFLGFMLHLQTLRDHHNHDITEYKDSEMELHIPSFAIPVPAKVFPSRLLDKEREPDAFISILGRLREAKGIMINTFAELESHAIKSLSDSDDIPPVYPVGPILNINSDKRDDDVVLIWLDNQPKSSVVFFCFGSMGGFDADQVLEIAHALEWSGHRFL
ncbi:hypothetical protein RJ639_018488 [Escallonia herrerae]|uniref:Uncharacterized protein n=1 Tax=Escallonia herrerae TaxID=1293975 RepID=A0AA89AH59_9ASTE|nr:hypothetical protein RJ639_018488 [Escallonia herrerae]